MSLEADLVALLKRLKLGQTIPTLPDRRTDGCSRCRLRSRFRRFLRWGRSRRGSVAAGAAFDQYAAASTQSPASHDTVYLLLLTSLPSAISVDSTL